MSPNGTTIAISLDKRAATKNNAAKTKFNFLCFGNLYKRIKNKNVKRINAPDSKSPRPDI